MKRLTDRKIVLITQKTRLEDLIKRYNTVGQAQFYIEHYGGDFEDYLIEDRTYHDAVRCAVSYLESYGRLQIIDREFVPGFLFGEKDLVIVIGRDGLVANSLKYLSTQKLVDVDLRLEHALGSSKEHFGIVHILRTNTKNDILAVVVAVDQLLGLCRRNRNILRAVASLHGQECILSLNLADCIDKVHLRRTHESCDEQVARPAEPRHPS